jgi:hypothetical protein
MKYAIQMTSGGMIYSPVSYWVRHSSSITVITSVIWEAVVLVLLLWGFCKTVAEMASDDMTTYQISWRSIQALKVVFGGGS